MGVDDGTFDGLDVGAGLIVGEVEGIIVGKEVGEVKGIIVGKEVGL